MAKIVANLKDSVAGILSGIDISNVDNLYGALERATRVLVQKANIPEASGTQNITLYSGITDYLCDPTIFGTAIRDLYPQGNSRQINDYVYKKPGEMFDRTKGYLPNGSMITFRYVKGVPIIRIVSKQVIQKVILDPMNDTTGWNGVVENGSVIVNNNSPFADTVTVNGDAQLIPAGGSYTWYYIDTANVLIDTLHSYDIPATLVGGKDYVITLTDDGFAGINSSIVETPVALSLFKDQTTYYQQPSSLRFSLPVSYTRAYLEKTLTNAIDLTSYQGVGVAFLAVYLPTGADFTSFTLRLGSDSSNYYEVSNTSQFLGSFVSGEFQIVALDLSTATIVGTPDITKIAYLRTTTIYNGNVENNVRFGGLWISLPSPSQILFQSAAIFMATGSNPSTSIVDDNDNILLNDPAYTLLEYESAIEVLLQSGGTLSSPMAAMITSKLHGTGNDIGLYAHYSGANPSEELRTAGSWYDNN